MDWNLLYWFIIGLGFIMQEYNSEICKNHCQIVGPKKKNWNDMVADVVQLEHSSIKRYASTFSNI